MQNCFNYLVSLSFLTKKHEEEILRARRNIGDFKILVDSGAFTAHTTGKKITLDEYCKRISEIPFSIEGYFSLDVIGDHKKTMENYIELIKMGFNPIPVFTIMGDEKDLDVFIEKSDYIAVGGLVGIKKEKVARKLLRVVKKLKNNNKRIHLLGYTSSKWVGLYRPDSIDSSSWEAAPRFGVMDVYVGKGVFKRLSKIDFIQKPDSFIEKILFERGYNISALKKKSNWRFTKDSLKESPLPMIQIDSWIRYGRDLKNKYGTDLYLAGIIPERLRIVTEVCKKINKKEYLC